MQDLTVRLRNPKDNQFRRQLPTRCLMLMVYPGSRCVSAEGG